MSIDAVMALAMEVERVEVRPDEPAAVGRPSQLAEADAGVRAPNR